MIQSEGIADGQDALTDAKVLGGADLQGHEGVGLPVDLEHGKVMIRVDANDARVTGGLIVQHHLYGIRAIDDVVIGDDMSQAVPDESGSRPLRHFEGIERPDIPTHRRIGDVDYRLRGFFKDGNGIEFFRTERFLGDEVQRRGQGGNRSRRFQDERLAHGDIRQKPCDERDEKNRLLPVCIPPVASIADVGPV